nr:uncharacterized protein CI109_006651 [Kwoniella shandongensis]KAA5525011.1 hypothetical protein CI109_006651 [Kwoniella shandongensis]
MPRDADDPIVQAEQSGYHSAAYSAAGAAQMRPVKAHHFCTHLRHDLHQCVIYDSDKSDARLIGIEYLVPESVFETLPEEEKKYWHSHKYEVESGMLMLVTKSLVPNAMTDIAERPAMLELHRTYGKTTHTWQYDVHPDLPLGPPQIMMAYTEDSQVDKASLKKRDEDLGVDTAAKKQVRSAYLKKEDMDRPPAKGADIWTEGKFGQLEWVDQKSK